MWRLGYLTWCAWQYARLLAITAPVLALVYLAVGPSGWFWLAVLLVGLAVAGLRATLRDFLRWETGRGWRS